MSKGPYSLETASRLAAERPRSRSLRKFGRDSSGASALEFALVSVPFIFLLLAVLQVGVVFFANYELERATSYGARLLRTGQAQNNNLSAAAFKTKVCTHLPAPLSCGKLQLDVRRFTSFGNAALTQPLDASGNLKSSFSYDPGAGGEVVVIRAFYPLQLPAHLPVDIRMSNMSSGELLLVATAAFRNEPFQPTN